MISTDLSGLIRRGRAASDRLDLAKASGNPFAEITARREGEAVLTELKKAVDDSSALRLIKASYGAPQSLFESSPGAVPRDFPQSSNVGDPAPRGMPTVTPADGSIGVPKAFPQSDKYSAEERRTAALNGQALPDGSHVIKNSADLARSFLSWAQRGKPTGALMEHLWTRAHALGAEGMLPSDFRATAKLALGALRKN
jgi:hypothetical protein